MNSIALTHPNPTPRALTRNIPRLSRSAGFWAVAFSFFVLTAFATAPSALYGLYAQQEGLSPLTITIVYAVYATGVVVSLVLAGHVSDWYGRRAVLIPGLVLGAVAALLFIVWHSLAGLLVARVLTGVALGASVATATAYIADLDAGPDGTPSRRSGIVATIANIGGLAVGPLMAGALAQYAPHGLTLPYMLLLAALVVGAATVVVSPEGRQPVHPRPRYRPQRLRAPAHARGQFLAATTAAFLVFAVGGLFAGLAGTFLAGPLHHPSAVLTGFAIFLNFGAGVLVQTTTTRWPAQRLIAAGLVPHHRRADRPGRIGVDLAREPGAVPDRRYGHRPGRRSDDPRQPERGHLHNGCGGPRRRAVDVLHGGLRRGVAAGRRPRPRAPAAQPPRDAADLRAPSSAPGSWPPPRSSPERRPGRSPGAVDGRSRTVPRQSDRADQAHGGALNSMNFTSTRFATHARTWLLIAVLTALLVGIGALIGGAFVYLFAGLAAALNVVGYWFSDRLALKASRARPVAPGTMPELEAIVQDLAQRARVPAPQLHTIPSEQPNAFATGRNPQHAAIAVTDGLIHGLPTVQVKGVLAHEFAHIKNRDILVSSIAATVAGAVAAIAEVFQWSLFFGGSDDEDSGPLGWIGLLATIILAPIAATLLQLGVSRQREYLADATGAQLLGHPTPLADALESLEHAAKALPMAVNPATASLYIVNPLTRQGVATLFATHPPLAERVRRLRALDHDRTPDGDRALRLVA